MKWLYLVIWTVICLGIVKVLLLLFQSPVVSWPPFRWPPPPFVWQNIVSSLVGLMVWGTGHYFWKKKWK
ncbi:MAG: hypothetical protein A2Z68_01090 [Candidatus Nealsonbacteria bacterium RBG_13_38_11]|uniref:Uncharacterized protein n=1 Tax=Candidatus Nealsonbacteria bacterium RBG_13_38_11 TaxID=1801662 RepID=A0A1G2E1A4_9BACT|nr:MAG: hypothetical protein A2Z68_01090 [Candidatus Nealsonbacteria bacterium RBG_13_38_11]